MKKVVLYALLLATAVLISCVKDEKTLETPECAITAFSVGDITCTLHTKAHDGSDSTYTKKIKGSSIVFNIDQIKGEIYPVDSLEPWVDVTHIVANIVSNGVAYGKSSVDVDTTYYAISTTDSLNLTNPYDLAIIAYDGRSFKRYKFSMPKKAVSSDTLKWEVRDDFKVNGDFKMFNFKGDIYYFQKDDAKIDYASVVMFNDAFYAKDKEDNIVKSEDGETWNTVSEAPVNLLAADKWNLYGFDGTSLTQTSDLETWKSIGEKDLIDLPKENISYVAYSRNTGIQDVVMIGLTDKTPVVWHKISSDNDVLNEEWQNIARSSSKYPLPADQRLSNVVRINDALYVICGKSFYKSSDNGINWNKQDARFALPEGVDAEAPVRMVVKDNTLFLAQSGTSGKMWSGNLLFLSYEIE